MVSVFPMLFKIGMYSWPLIIVELLAYWLMITPFFRIGLPVFRREESFALNASKVKMGETLETDSGKFKFTGRQSCVFRPRFFVELSFGFQERSIPLYGSIEFRKYTAVMVTRSPLGLVIFIGLWLICWTLMCLDPLFHGHSLIGPLAETILLWCFVLLIGWAAISSGKKQLLDAYEEFKLNFS